MEINQLQQLPFAEIIAYIESHYSYTPSAFKNGTLENSESQNQGSAKLFFFARLQNLSKQDTLLLFSEHYQAVLDDENGTTHQNIRNFMKDGWEGISFEKVVLTQK